MNQGDFYVTANSTRKDIRNEGFHRVQVACLSIVGPTSSFIKHFIRLCKEYEFIAERALTTPANTSELVELIEYVKKTQATTMGELYQVQFHDAQNIKGCRLSGGAGMIDLFELVPC